MSVTSHSLTYIHLTQAKKWLKVCTRCTSFCFSAHPDDSHWSPLHSAQPVQPISSFSSHLNLFPLNMSRRSPDRAFLIYWIHQNVSRLLTASLSVAALLLLLVNVSWFVFSSSCPGEYELVRVQLGLAAAAWSLAEDVQTQGGLEVFFGCLLL